MYAALHFVNLPMAAALRNSPDLKARPCAVLEVDPHAQVEKVKLPLVAVNEAARSTGIDAGWPLNRALVRCPDLRVMPPDPEGETEILRRLTEAAETLTPDLEITCRDTLLLDLSRTTSRQAGGLSRLTMPDGALRHVRAATPDLALLAVRSAALHGCCVSSREVRELPLAFLAWLPGGDTRLPLLADWGLGTLGDLMALPRQDLAERLGPDAAEWHDVLHGKACRLLRLHRPPESLAQSLDFEHEVTATEPLVFAGKRLLHSLAARLAARHVAVRELRVGLSLASGGSFERIIRLPEPRVEEAELLRPVQTALDSLVLTCAVTGMSLDVVIAAPTAAQRDWFVRQFPRPERWTDTLAQLEGLVGQGNVGVPVPPRSHRPDSFAVLPFGEAVASPVHGHVPSHAVPLRRFRPPFEISVAHDDGPRPLALLTGPYRGEITGLRGPFRFSGDWWEPETSWQRLEWDVEITGRHLLRLSFLPPARWLLDGLYT